MHKFQFKTNIKCGGCVNMVSPYLDSEKTIEKWAVDLDSPDRILTAEGSALTHEIVITTIRKAGYHIEPIS